jgi:endoglucanase
VCFYWEDRAYADSYTGGGNNFAGSTTCISGWTCTYSNDWYSQCIQGAPASINPPASSSTKVTPTVISSTTLFHTSTAVATTKATSASQSSSSAAAPAATGAALPFLGGVNTAGYDFSVSTDGSFSAQVCRRLRASTSTLRPRA